MPPVFRMLAFIALTGRLLSPAPVSEWIVATGSNGNGTPGAPFGSIQAALAVAQPCDVITVKPGTYNESVHTTRGGSPGKPITLRAEGARGTVVVTSDGRVLTVTHPNVVVQGLVMDGQYGRDDLVVVRSGADNFTLRNSEVRRSGRDAIDIAAPDDVTIDRSLIHHALNSAGGRSDAHGIVAGAVHRLTIRDTEIHTFSGDGVQLDPGRSAPGWDSVLIERCRIWLGPLTEVANGFAAGTVPGENAVDTKAGSRFPRATLVIRDTSAWGFRNGLISNMAAFNLKENVTALLDRVSVWDSEIAFRVRGPASAAGGAHVTVQNAVVFSVATAFRYEDDIERLRVWNVTIGAGVARAFHAASSRTAGLDLRNLLVLATGLPREAVTGAGNMAVSGEAFVGAAGHDYHLAKSSRAVDAGVAILGVTSDRDEVARPQGRSSDVGVYERYVGPAAGR